MATYIPPEIVKNVKKIDLLCYLQNFEPSELVHVGGQEYTTKTHGSLKISNGMWMWWSKGIGGKSALDYLIKVKGERFIDAVQMLAGQTVTIPPVPHSTVEKQEKRLCLPQKNPTTKVVEQYLEGRGISKELIRYCIQKELIYEDKKYHNVVFVGCDSEGKARHAAYRSCNKTRIMGDALGSDKGYCFRFADGKGKEVHVFESAIDLLSYATLARIDPMDLETCNLISLSGIQVTSQKNGEVKLPLALGNIMCRNPKVQRVYLHLDQDEAGRMATKQIMKAIEDRVKVIDDPPPKGKDFNEYLLHVLEKKKESRGYENER